MSDKYKIGEISKFLNIPMSNLRFYEDKGIVTPHKEESNHYRYYDAWNLNDLMDTIHYRDMSFSLKEIENTINNYSLSAILEEYKAKEQELLEDLRRRQKVLDILSTERIRIQHLQEYTGHFTKSKSLDLVFYRFRMKNSIQQMDGTKSIPELNANMKAWLKASPHPIAAFYIPLGSLLHNLPEDIDYWYGYSLSYDVASNYGIKVTGTNEYLPSSPCLYTVFCAHEEGSFMPTFYHDVYEKIKEQGYTLTGSPYGRLITKTHESDGVYNRYFEVWIPVSE